MISPYNHRGQFVFSMGFLTDTKNVWVGHALGMPGTFSPPLRVTDPDIHHGKCVTQVPWCMPGSLSSDFLWSRLRGKRSRHSRCIGKPQFCVSGKRQMMLSWIKIYRYYNNQWMWDMFAVSKCDITWSEIAQNYGPCALYYFWRLFLVS